MYIIIIYIIINHRNKQKQVYLSEICKKKENLKLLKKLHVKSKK